jgi:hypothetical protein
VCRGKQVLRVFSGQRLSEGNDARRWGRRGTSSYLLHCSNVLSSSINSCIKELQDCEAFLQYRPYRNNIIGLHVRLWGF